MNSNLDLTIITEFLNEFSEQHDLQNRVLISCNTAIEQCYNDDIEIGLDPFDGIPPENIRVTFHSQFLVAQHVLRAGTCFKTKLSIFNNNGSTEDFDEMDYVGYYELDVNEKGESIDDWLVFESDY